MSVQTITKTEIFNTLLAEGWQHESAQFVADNADDSRLNVVIRKWVGRVKNIKYIQPRNCKKGNKYVS